MTPTANLNGPLPAPMGVPLEEIIERAAKRAQYLALVEVVRTVNVALETIVENSHCGGPIPLDEIQLDRYEILAVIRIAAAALGVPVPKDAQQR